MDILSPRWRERYLTKADAWAKDCSKDPSSQVGCILVSDDGAELSTGYNGLPRGVQDLDQRISQRPEKYLWMAHAEENAITNAARHGVRLQGATAFVTFAPCSRCAGMLINAGVATVVYRDAQTRMPADEWRVAQAKFSEAGVKLICEPAPA